MAQLVKQMRNEEDELHWKLDWENGKLSRGNERIFYYIGINILNPPKREYCK
jgi:hypothetical protein